MTVKQDPTLKIFAAIFFTAMVWTQAHSAHARSGDEGNRSSEVGAKNAKTQIRTDTKTASKPGRLMSKVDAESARAEAKSVKVQGKSDKSETKLSKNSKADAKSSSPSGRSDKADAKTDKALGIETAKSSESKSKTTDSKAESVRAGRPNEHVIAQGETLGQIAKDLGISLTDLMAANNMTNGDKIFFGQKLQIPADPKDGVVTKNGVLLRVPKGFTINRIAALYGITPRAIIRANNLINPDRLREGDKLLIPGAKQVIVLVPPPPCYKNPITFYRVRSDQTLELPVEYCNGKPNSSGIQELSDFTRSIAHPTDVNLHPRLLSLLQEVSDHYPGRRIEIISGQRAGRKGNESYHTKGQALDFRVEGISNLALTNYLRTFDKVGVGYYPNSVFIHMDTRERNAYWIDYSEPGEKAIYGRKGLTDEDLQEIRDRRKAKRHPHEHNMLSADNDAKEESDAAAEQAGQSSDTVATQEPSS